MTALSPFRLARSAALWVGVALLGMIALFVLGVLWPVPAAAPVVSDRPIAFVDVSVLDVVRGTLTAGRTVLVDDGRIAAVGPADSVEVPAGARTVRATGKVIMPALWDMHTHVYAVSPLLDMPLYIAYGVTNVRDMQGCPKPGDPFIACAADKRRWTAEASDGRRVGPRIVVSTSFMANGPGTLERISGVPVFFGTATPEESRAFVKHQKIQGIDAMKVYDRLPRDAYFALVAEAKAQGLDVVGHRPLAVSAIEAATAGQRSIEHARVFLQEAFPGSAALRAAAERGEWAEDRRRMVDEHDPAAAQAIFRAFVMHGTWYVPTHLTRWMDAYADDPAVREDSLLRYLHPLMKWQWLEDIDATLARDTSAAARQAYRDFYRKGLDVTAAAHAAGVGILAGTDYIVAGADVHRELEQLVLAGLSPVEALRTATTNPARYMNATADYGSIEAGKIADMILLDADPLRDIRNTRRIDAVVFNGNLYDRPALDQLHRVVRERAQSWAVGCRILWNFLRNPVSY